MIDLPIGGSTGLDHESSVILDEAITWYGANFATCERPIIPALRRRFGLDPLQAVEVVRAVNLRRARVA